MARRWRPRGSPRCAVSPRSACGRPVSTAADVNTSPARGSNPSWESPTPPGDAASSMSPPAGERRQQTMRSPVQGVWHYRGHRWHASLQIGRKRGFVMAQIRREAASNASAAAAMQGRGWRQEWRPLAAAGSSPPLKPDVWSCLGGHFPRFECPSGDFCAPGSISDLALACLSPAWHSRFVCT